VFLVGVMVRRGKKKKKPPDIEATPVEASLPACPARPARPFGPCDNLGWCHLPTLEAYAYIKSVDWKRMPLWLSAIKAEWLMARMRNGVIDLDFDPRREQAVQDQAARDNRRSRNCARRQSLRNVGGSPSEESAPMHGDDGFGSFLDGLDASPDAALRLNGLVAAAGRSDGLDAMYAARHDGRAVWEEPDDGSFEDPDDTSPHITSQFSPDDSSLAGGVSGGLSNSSTAGAFNTFSCPLNYSAPHQDAPHASVRRDREFLVSDSGVIAMYKSLQSTLDQDKLC